MKTKLLIMSLLFSVLGWGQVTISSQDFESTPATPTLGFTNISGGNSTGTNPAAGVPASANLFSSGARGWQAINTTSIVTFSNQSLTGYTNAFLEFKLAGMSLNGTNGIDGTDLVTVSISVDGGTTYSSEITIAGSGANQRWGFGATGTASITYDGNNTTTAITSPSATGVSTVTVNIPNANSQVRVRISMFNNDPNERWVIDDVRIRGTISGPSPEINVTGNGNTILTGDFTPVTTDFTDFGNVNIASSLTRNFVIQNLGVANLGISGATISGANASEFIITASPVGTITSLGNAGLMIQFISTASGIRTATVTIANNDSNEGSYTFAIQGNGVCVPATIASIFPASGSVGTEVTINASSGSLLASTVNFNGTVATIISSSTTQLVVVVPAGATTGAINIVNTTTGCTTSTASFTIISQDLTSCEGASTSDLIIYDIHDEQTGSGGFITLYNGTAASVNLLNYRIYRTSNHDDGNEVDYANLTGTLASGALGILKVSVGSCGPASTNGTIDNGFNQNDGIQLRDATGTVVIDDVDTYLTGPGYYMVRNTGALNARTSYVAADWSTTPLGAGVCEPSAGLTPPDGATPSISAQPTITLTCASTTAVLTVSATEGFVGGNILAYQWYVVAPNTTTWTALTNTGVYTGATSATLNISSLTGLDGYQYYCQVRENTVTCYIATVAVKINTGATVWNGTIWSNGMPNLSKAATINGNYTTATNGSFRACNLTINTTFTLTVSANTYVEIQNNITNNGTFTILNTGSLVQINDLGVNTGNITYERIASVKLQDYVYWSSPVTGFDVNSISPLTPAYYHWLWNPTVGNTNGGLGNWQNASTTMTAGQGYIVRAPSGFSNAANQNWAATFNNGVPRNGVFTPTIARGSYTGANYAGTNGVTITANDDNWNLLGNPYPSAISIDLFLTANPQLDGFVRLWTHGTLPVSAINPFYASFVYNYTVGDYVAINGAGATSGPGVLSVIGAGQGFFVLMDSGAATTSTATFNNAMRNRNYANSQFYKTTNHKITTTQAVVEDIERNRIWIDLVSPTMETTRTLVAYVEGATSGKDRMFDALTDYKASQNFYSLIGSDIMTIQGRSLPFDVNDQVPMGIKTPTNGTYTIAIATVDGLFSGNAQTIYIEDKLLGTITDVTATPYQFTATQGITNDRFVLRYTNQALSNADFNLSENAVTVFTSNNEIKINSSSESIKDYTVYNVLGQILVERNNVNANQSAVSSILKNNQALIVKVILENGQTVIKKIIF